jgi:Fe-S-cluster containining protein
MNRHQRRAAEAMGRANTKLRTLLKPVYDRFDAGLVALIDANHLAARIPCRKGCSYCCDQLILTSFPEAMEIALRYPEVVAEVRGEMEAQGALLQEMGIDERVVDIFRPEFREAREAFHDRYFAQRRPCAFLDPKKKVCRVYDARPLACRAHHVMNVDPEKCDTRGAAAAGVTIEGVDPGEGYTAAMQAIASVSEELVGAYALGPVPCVVLAADDALRRRA